MIDESDKRLLARLSLAHGVQLAYQAEGGQWRKQSHEDIRAVLQVMGVGAGDDEAVARSLSGAPEPPNAAIAAPEGVACHLPQWLAHGRAWGVTCQLYGLRSHRNHGIGDFEDLARLAEDLAAQGADFVGVNPVHALFTADPERRSPFSPSNRRFINPLYIALDNVPGITAVPMLDEAVRARLASAKQINYGEVAAFKLGVLRSLWKRLCADDAGWVPAARARFDAFVASGGEMLLQHARFEALSHFMVAAGNSAGWQGWPSMYRDCRSEAVRDFAAEHDDKVRFHLWLQWVADTQLGEAARRAHAAGMRIGLYLDFAVGTAPDGSATWTNPALVVAGASIGAPPDSFFEHGQDWGLAPLSPTVLREQQFAPYQNELETVMRHAGAIRIDHAMGLHRLYW
ncbi:MAG: 4-alpha-glucanotransferase, partial [Burkholderiales bacterium]